MSWYKTPQGNSCYLEEINDYCSLKIDRWEHGYYVATVAKSQPDIEVALRYFYSFQDARAFLTNLSRLINKTH